MSKVDLLIQTAEAESAKGRPYAGEGANGIGCSAFTRICLYGAGVITKAERDDDNSMWAGKGIVGFLADTSRFEKITWKPSNLKRGDILWSLGYHVAIWDGINGVYEAAPLGHGLSSNGRTAVGHFPSHSYYNCGTGTNSWTCIYRIKEDKTINVQEIIDAYVKKALEIAANDKHGYSNVVGSNLGNPDYDCGSFVSAAIRSVGLIDSNTIFEPNSATGTWGYDVILTKAGFTKMAFNYNNVKKGDILIRHGAHTELAIGGNQQVGAHDNYDGKPGDGSGREISVVPLSTNWTYMYRLVESGSGSGSSNTTSDPVLTYGSTGEAVRKLQRLLNEKISAGLMVDGSFGPATLKAVQEYQAVNGLVVDGSVGPATWASLNKTNPTPPETIDGKQILEAALKVANGVYGNNPERKEKLITEYGLAGAEKIQAVVDLAYKK